MRIDSPVASNANITGSFSGSFTGTGNFTGLTADSVDYANVTNKPTLISSSAQLQDDFLDTLGDGVISSSAQVTLTDLSDYDANDHIDHTGVTLTAGNGLTGGGTIAASRTFAVGAGDGITVNADDIQVDATVLRTTGDAVISASAQVSLTGLSDYDANDHIDHTSVTMTAGNGLTGGGTIASTRTFNIGQGDGISVTANDIAVDGTVLRTTGDNVVSASAQLTADYDSRYLNTTGDGVISSSAQVDLENVIGDTDDVSEGSSNLYYTDARVKTKMNAEGAISASVLSSPSQGTIRLATNGVNTDVDSGLQTGDSPTFSGLTVSNNVTINGNLNVLGTKTELQVATLNVEDKNITIASGAADSSAADGAGLTIDGANESLTWDHGNSRFTFSDDLNVGGNITVTGTVDGRDVASDGTKLDGIEASADVTDTANVTSAGALMDSELASIADVKALDQSVISGASPTFGTANMTDASNKRFMTDAQETKLDSVESNADVTDTANVTSAGALMDSEVTNLAFVKGLTKGISDGNVLTANDAVADNDFLRINGTEVEGLTAAEVRTAINVEDGADVTDTSNVTSAGALMDSELTNLAAVKAINQSLVTTADVRFDSIGVGTAAPGTSGVIRATNDIVAFYSSDERLKDNIEEIPNALKRVEDIRGVQFVWNKNQSVYEGADIGVIAQEVEKVAQSLVTDRDNGYKAVKYEKLTALLVQAVKELSAKVKELENR